MTILQGTMSDGTLVPVQADSQGRLVAEGLPGPQGPPGVGQLPPNPQNGDVLAWDNGLIWVSGIIPAGPPQTSPITKTTTTGDPIFESIAYWSIDGEYTPSSISWPSKNSSSIFNGNTSNGAQGQVRTSDGGNDLSHIRIEFVFENTISGNLEINITGNTETTGPSGSSSNQRRFYYAQFDGGPEEQFNNLWSSNGFWVQEWLNFGNRTFKELILTCRCDNYSHPLSAGSTMHTTTFSISAFRLNGAEMIATEKIIDLEFGDNTGFDEFNVGDKIDEKGNGDDASGTVKALDGTATPPTMAVEGSTGTWDVGSRVVGPIAARYLANQHPHR